MYGAVSGTTWAACLPVGLTTAYPAIAYGCSLENFSQVLDFHSNHGYELAQ
jgi:hypothetical protein